MITQKQNKEILDRVGRCIATAIVTFSCQTDTRVSKNQLEEAIGNQQRANTELIHYLNEEIGVEQ